MNKNKEPLIIEKLLDSEEYDFFYRYLLQKPKDQNQYDSGFGRYIFSDPQIDLMAKKITPLARKIFKSDTLLPSYSLFAHYEGESSLYRHIDDNACTYTIDMCIYQTEPWDLGVSYNGEDKYYTLYPNQALAYYGNDQEHWRGPFPKPNEQIVAMIFFHFVEPEHWFYTKGPEYLNVIRGVMTEDEWNRKSI